MMASLQQLIQPSPETKSRGPVPREELEETVRRWLEANKRAEEENDWSHLAPMYTDDAEYRWTVGPTEEFVARGKKQIEEWAVGIQMAGFEGWTYPYERVLIDEAQGEVVGLWRQVSPAVRPDGSRVEVAGVGGSWFRYGGDHKWAWQRDFFDLLSVFAAMTEASSLGQLSPVVKKKVRTMAMGGTLPGHEKIRPAGGFGAKLRQGAAFASMVLLGR